MIGHGNIPLHERKYSLAVTYTTAVKTARMDAVIAQIDAGTGAGKIKIRNSSDTVLATLTLADPAERQRPGF